MNNFNIQNLVKEVTAHQEAERKAEFTAHKKDVEAWCKERDVVEVDRIIVKATITEQLLSNYSVSKKYEVKQESIVDAIQAVNPDDIDKAIYFFPHSNYLFCTDKGKIYNLKEKARPYTEKEKATIDRLRTDLTERQKEIKQIAEEAHRVKKALLNVEENKPAEFNPLYTDIYVKYPTKKAAQKFYKWYKDLEAEYKKDLEEAKEKISRINETAKKQPIYTIHPMKADKQIRVYVGKNYADRYRALGYSIIEQDKERNVKQWDDEAIAEVERTEKYVSYSFIMNTNAFRSMCKHGVLVTKGYYIDNDGQRKIIENSRPKEAVTLQDDKGEIMHFTSKTEAAKFYGVSNKAISTAIKQASDGQIPTIRVKAQNNKKGFTLVDDKGGRYEFESKTDCALYFQISRPKLNTILKGKVAGDVVSIKSKMYNGTRDFTLI